MQRDAQHLYNTILQTLKGEVRGKTNLEKALKKMKKTIITILLNPKKYFANELEFLKFKILLDTKLIRESTKKTGKICVELDCDLRGLYVNYIRDNNKTNTKLLKNINNAARKNTKGWKNKIFHVLSDVDDTLYAHTLGGIAGSDDSWYQKQAYPGIKEFYKILYNKGELYPYDFSKYSTILSATPAGAPLWKRKERLNDPQMKKIIGDGYSFLHGKDTFMEATRDIRFKNPWHGPSLLAPDTWSVASTKIERFDTYRALFPEYQFCFIGDNGQGDLDTGLHILQSSQNNIVCIHNVLEKSWTAKRNRKFNNRVLKNIYKDNKKIKNIKRRLFFFDTYLDLAFIFHNLDYFTEEDVDKMANAVQHDMNESIKKDPTSNSIRTCAIIYPNYYNQYFCPRHREYYQFKLKKHSLDCIKR